jgi:uncharacterized protein affecting Mg2+/Co2+ transport
MPLLAMEKEVEGDGVLRRQPQLRRQRERS